MGLFRYLVLGTALFFAYKELVKKRKYDGKSMIDDLDEKTSPYVNEVKNLALQFKRDYTQTHHLY